MSDFKTKMYQIRYRLGLGPHPIRALLVGEEREEKERGGGYIQPQYFYQIGASASLCAQRSVDMASNRLTAASTKSA